MDKWGLASAKPFSQTAVSGGQYLLKRDIERIDGMDDGKPIREAQLTEPGLNVARRV